MKKQKKAQRKKVKAQREKAMVLFNLCVHDNVVEGQGLLDMWANNPSGYSIICETTRTSVTGVSVKGCNCITIERVSPDGKILMRRLEAIRKKWDENPLDFDPVLVVVPAEVEKCPAWEQFMRRAAVVVRV